MFELKKLRLENGLKRSELAKLTGIHQNTIANYENGICEAPYDTLIKFADFFDVSIDEMLGRNRETISSENSALLTAREKKMLSKYRLLGSQNQNRVDDYINILTKVNID